MISIPAIYLPIHNDLIIIFTLAKYHCYAFSLSIVFNPAVWNPSASAVGGMRCNSREVALSSASRDNPASLRSWDQFHLRFKFRFTHFRRMSLIRPANIFSVPHDSACGIILLTNFTALRLWNFSLIKAWVSLLAWLTISECQIPRRYAPGIIPNPDISGLDNSTYKIQFTLFLNFESHYHLRFEHRIACS